MAAVKFLVVLLALFMMASAKLYKKDMLKMVNNVIKQQVNKPVAKNNEGSFKPCKKGDPEFQLTWTPKEIEAGDQVVINFNMKPTVDLNGGTAGISVWLPDYKDPIYQATEPFTCEMINKFFPKSCPFIKGKEVKVAGYKYQISSDLPIPGGQFVIKAEVKNKSGELFACMNGTITVKEQEYNYDDYNYNY